MQPRCKTLSKSTKLHIANLLFCGRHLRTPFHDKTREGSTTYELNNSMGRGYGAYSSEITNTTLCSNLKYNNLQIICDSF